MNRFTNRLAVVLLQLSVAVAAFGQNWPSPSKSPNTEPACTSPCLSTSGKTVGYTLPISSFTGRFLDSQNTNDIQYAFRTARAGKLVFSPDGQRLYMLVGGMTAAYNTSEFFRRLNAGEAMMPSTAVPLTQLNQRPGAPETFLRPDRFFYPEWGGGWSCPQVDGQARLNDIDVDDQGYLYLSHFVFGWGIVKDDLRTDNNMSIMQSQYQHFPYGEGGDSDPVHILAFHSGAQYYMLVNVTTQTEVWNVTDRTNPRRVAALTRLNFSQGAKNAAGDRIAILDGSTGAVSIYTPDSLAAGGGAMASFSPGLPFSYSSLSSDGTNFFAGYQKGTMKISVFTPSGGTFSKSSEFDTGYAVDGGPIRAHDGYLTIITSNGLLLFKISSSLGFTDVPLKSSFGTSGGTDRYFPQYYFNFAPPGYGFPHFYVHSSDAAVIKDGTKTYLVFLAGGLADVYELQNGDGISLTQTGPLGTINLKTPATEQSKTFYGDPLGFTATTTAPAPMTIKWDFGNPEAVAGADPNIINPGQTGPATITHKYSGIGSAAGLTPRTVTVTNVNDTTVYAQTTVTMQPPVARVGLTNYGSLITATNTSGNIPVVVLDKWYDASDGRVEGHTSGWSIYNTLTPTGSPATTSLPPSQQQDVGQCGPHYLSFQGHYGQNGSLLPSTDYVAPVGGLGIAYTVRPFAPNVTISANGATVSFSNATKLTTDTNVLTPAIMAGLQFKWELLNTNLSVAQTGPSGAYSAIVPWSLPISSIARGMMVRLTLTSATDFAGVCGGQGLNTASYVTPALNAPDPVINGGCNSGVPPCTFTVGSLSGVNPTADGWTYSWSVAGQNLFGTAATFTPNFPASGNYTVQVSATNSFGTNSATKPQTVTVAVCPPYRPNVDVFINYAGNSGCTPAPTAPQCVLGETLAFSVGAFQYDLNCGPHTYQWNFGDGGQATGPNPTHAYASGSSYSVSCIVSDGSGSPQTLSQTVSLKSSQQTDQCSPGMNQGNVYANYSTTSGSCSATGGTCGIGETIQFSAASLGYSFACDTHTFQWTFGDGSQASGLTTTHAYSGANTYPATLTISRPSKGLSITVPFNVKVGTNEHQGSCSPPMSAGSNVFIVYTNNSGSCSQTGGTCTPNETVNFIASSFNYDFNCAAHTFTWDFGDGGSPITGKTATHTFSTAKTYTVTLTIENTGQKVTMTAPVKVGNDVTQTPLNSVEFSIQPWVQNGVVIPNGYRFTPVSDPVGAVAKWTWDFGDGTCPSGESVCNTSTGEILHVFPTGANYTVAVTGRTSAGQTATAVHPLVSVPPRRRSVGHT